MTYAGFYAPWLVAMAIATGEPTAASHATVLHLEGMDFPVVQSVLAVAGVLMARPLARKNESTLTVPQFLVVTAIMLVAALAWVTQSRPTVLFSFVVSIGLGFSGYALVEATGNEVQDTLKRILASISGILSNIGVIK